MGQELHDEFGPQGYNIKTAEFAYCMVRFAAVFSTELSYILPSYGKNMTLDNTKSKQLLEIQYRPTKESLVEMVNCMIDKGWIPDKRPQ